MILGIGTDIVEIDRIRASVEKAGERFVKRILTEIEWQRYEAIANQDIAIAFLAKRFAAKEAAVKALGTGIGRGISFHHFSVTNDVLGKPLLEVEPAISAITKLPLDKLRWHISLTDETHYAQAFVILESID